MAFPTNTTVLDNFNRSDTHPLTGWVDLVGGLDAAGSTAKSSGGTSVSYFNTSYANPVEFYVTLTTKPGNTVSAYIFAIKDPANAHGYLLRVTTQSGNDEWSLLRIDGPGDTTQLGSTATQEITNGDGIGLEVTDSANGIKAFYRSGTTWTQIGSTQSDTTYTGNAYPQVELDDTVCVIDDLSGGTVAGGASITQHSFRFRNDDGDEDAATWKAALNADLYMER